MKMTLGLILIQIVLIGVGWDKLKEEELIGLGGDQGGYHIYYSGNKLDDAMENPDPGKGNLGLRVGPFIGPTWDWNDSYGGRHELYLSCQIPQIGQRHGGIPEPFGT